jgi:chemotaxis protein CheZ
VQHDHLASETQRVTAALVQDPVRAVASGEIMNYLSAVADMTKATDEHLTEIMMAQDFHDLTGQVIARVVALAAVIEQQLVQLVIQTAPANTILHPIEKPHEHLSGPVVNPETATDVVTDQSQVDDLLASLGF